MPKVVDYAGRFAFFELASFTLVRDHGVDHLSRHALARVLATSISTIRRLLNSEADLRQLALNEVAYRRRRRLTPATRATGADAGARLLLPWLPSRPEHIAEELVWWRLAIAAPTTADLPPDVTVDQEDGEDDDEGGPVHHRFAIANHGFVPSDVLNTVIERPRPAVDADGEVDVVVAARHDRDEDLAHRLAVVVRTTDPSLDPEVVTHHAAILHALVDGLGVAVCLGRLRPDEAVVLVRNHLESLARVAGCPAPSP